jgi:hypothetical protein
MEKQFCSKKRSIIQVLEGTQLWKKIWMCSYIYAHTHQSSQPLFQLLIEKNITSFHKPLNAAIFLPLYLSSLNVKIKIIFFNKRLTN